MKGRLLVVCAYLVMGVACAGVSRDVSSQIASQIGADWIVVQYRFDGAPINCWKLSHVGISNEPASDGIFWKDSATGHLVHISGWSSRVQVANGDFLSAARLVGVDATACGSGVYRVP